MNTTKVKYEYEANYQSLSDAENIWQKADAIHSSELQLDVIPHSDYHPPDSYRDGMFMNSFFSISEKIRIIKPETSGQMPDSPDSYRDGSQGDGYRFGFNGMEGDKEVSGNGNSYTTPFRQYDPRLGRWKSVDELETKYPNESPYCFVGNSPMIYIDVDGREKIVVIGGEDKAVRKGGDKFKFINAGLNQTINYLKENPDEEVTILITDVDIHDYTKDEIRQWINKIKKDFKEDIPNIKDRLSLVYINDRDEITNYINSKSTDENSISKERIADKVTSLSIFGHGLRHKDSPTGNSSFEPAYGLSEEERAKWVYHGSNPTKIPQLSYLFCNPLCFKSLLQLLNRVQYSRRPPL